MYLKPKETTVFQRVRAPKLEPLGPQSRAQEGVRTAKMTSNKAAGGVRAVKVRPVRLDCLSGLWSGMQRDAPGAEPKGEQRSKLSKRPDI